MNAVKGLVKFDLSQSEKFMDHHKKLHSKTVAILEQFDNGFYTFLEDNEDMVMVDLGANVGLFSLFMSPLCSEIYALEPTPSHVEIMEELLEKLEEQFAKREDLSKKEIKEMLKALESELKVKWESILVEARQSALERSNGD